MSLYLRTVLWMFGAIASFSAMAAAGRFVSDTHDTFEIMVFRSLVSLSIVLAVTTARRQWHQVGTQDLPMHMARNVFHFTGQNLWFFALALMPLAQVFAIEFTTPIWVILLSALFLGDRLRAVGLMSAVIGFIGILIVTRPGVEPLGAGVIPAAASAICFAITMIFTKKLTSRQSIYAIMFYLTFLQTIFGIICAGYDGDVAWPTSQTAPYLVLIGITGLSAHFCLTNALKIAPASVVAPIDFMRLPAIALVGYLLFSEPLDIYVLLGAGLIFSGNYLNIMSEKRNKTP